jgi:hypothetical protein
MSNNMGCDVVGGKGVFITPEQIVDEPGIIERRLKMLKNVADFWLNGNLYVRERPDEIEQFIDEKTGYTHLRISVFANTGADDEATQEA